MPSKYYDSTNKTVTPRTTVKAEEFNDLNSSVDVGFQGVLADIEDLDQRQASANVTYTVGTGGDYTTLNEAVLEMSKLYPIYVKGGIEVTLQLMTGFTMSEQILIYGIDLSWIKITSVDAEVTIIRSALSQALHPTIAYGYPAIGGVGAILPTIDVLFTMDSSGTATLRSGIIYAGSSGFIESGAGCKNAADSGLAVLSSRVSAIGTVWSGSATTGATAQGGALLDLSYSDCTGCDYGVISASASNLNALSTDAGTAGTYGFYVAGGGIMSATSATGTLSQTKNTISASGIIFQ